MENGLIADKTYIQNNTELSLTRILADKDGEPAVYALGVAGPLLCRKVRELLPEETFTSIENDGVEMGLSSMAIGEEKCRMLFDLFCAIHELREVGSNG